MATVISNKQSTYGSPYAFYTLDLTYKSRTATTAVVSYTLKVNLQYSSSNLGTGYALTAIIYAGGSNSGEITLKPSNTSWSGTTVHTFTGSFTVTGLSPSTSSISTALYSSAYYGGAYRACIRPAVSGSNLSIPEQTKYTITYNANGGSGAPASQSYYYGGSNIYLSSTKPTKSGYKFLGWSLSSTATSPSYSPGQAWSSNNASNYTLYAVWELANGKSTFSLSSNIINLDTSTITINLSLVTSSNTHTITLTIAGSTYTLATGVGSSHSFTLPASSYAKLFTNSKSTTGTITATTYASGSSLGSYSESVTIILPESLGKPDKPSAVIVNEQEFDAIIKLTKPAFKYSATFVKWDISTTAGIFNITGDRIDTAIQPEINKNAVLKIRAIDSRGYASEPVFIVWHFRKTGLCIFVNNRWIPCESYTYVNGQWVGRIPMLYNDFTWFVDGQAKIELVDRVLLNSEGDTLVSSDGYTLLGKKD